MRDSSHTDFTRDSGHLVLDFTNTVYERTEYLQGAPPPAEQELLKDYASLLRWCETLKVLSKSENAALVALSERAPLKARAALHAILQLRETIFQLCLERITRREIDPLSLEKLNRFLGEQPAARLLTHKGGFQLTRTPPHDKLLSMMPILIDDAVALFTSAPLERLRVCAMKNCGWLFLDTSKNGKRKWCDMSDCGNLSKARRFYRRSRS